MNNSAAAALYVVKQAGRLADLSDRIASAWSEARERRLARTISEEGALSIDLQRFLKLSREQADEAARQFLDPSYSEVAIEALLAFAKEIATPPRESRIRPIEEERRLWNPHDGGMSPEDLNLSAQPEGDPERIPPAIRRATRHAIQHKAKERRAGR